MSEIRFEYDWESPEKATGEELRATWASLSIIIDNQIITEWNDPLTNSVRKQIYLPLYPLAEWIVVNWWFLMNEPFTPSKFIDNTEYDKRHVLLYAQDGYALPDLTIRPVGETTMLIWKQNKKKFQNLSFINSGEVVIESIAFKKSLTDFISAVVSKLDASKINDTILQSEWDTILNIENEEKDFCLTTASIGLDPYSVSTKESNAIIKIFNELPGNIGRDFFPACHANAIIKEASVTLEIIDEIKDTGFDIKPLRTLQNKLHHKRKAGIPWEDGYKAASTLRRVLGINGTPIIELNQLGRVFGVDYDNIAGNIIIRDMLPNTINVIGGTNNNNSPVFAFSHQFNNKKGEKFTLCRALYNYLFSDYSQSFLITKSHIDSQKRNRAFAAEFIIPASVLKKRIKSKKISKEQIEEFADEFQVQTLVIEHQIENHHIAEIE